MTLNLTPEQEYRPTTSTSPHPRLRFCLLILILLLLPAIATAQNVRTAQTAIQAQYRRLATFLTRNDIDAYGNIHTPDCLFLTPDGKPHSLDAFLDTLTQAEGEGTHIQSVVATIRRIRSHPSGYALFVEERITFTKTDDTGELGAKGQKHTVVLVTSGRDLWQNKDGAWLRSKAHMQTIISLTIDGKRIPKLTTISRSLPPR